MKWYATLINSFNCELGHVSANTREELNVKINRAFLTVIEDGDKIRISYE